MRRCLLLGILLAALSAAPADAKGRTTRPAPAGSRFYAPSARLVQGAHGSVVWARRLTGREVVLHNASENELVLYRSTGVNGKSTGVSGAVALPRGKAPKGGWPVITWGHGTSGIGDACAPTRGNALRGYDHALLQRWLKAGYAVVRTDYEGLGTPGVHPYLIGASEGHSMLDMVRAARTLDPRIGRRIVIAGHSQGGHAALWAAALAARYTPELKVRGTVAFAPASHLGEQSGAFGALTSPGGGLSAIAALIIRAVDATSPSLEIGGRLTARAAALYPQTLTKCLTPLGAADSLGGLAPADFWRPGVDPGLFTARLNANDPEDLIIRTPVLVEQGKADGTVFPAFSDQLDQEYVQHHVPVAYKTYDGVSHTGVVTAAAADATAWIRARLP